MSKITRVVLLSLIILSFITLSVNAQKKDGIQLINSKIEDNKKLIKNGSTILKLGAGATIIGLCLILNNADETKNVISYVSPFKDFKEPTFRNYLTKAGIATFAVGISTMSIGIILLKKNKKRLNKLTLSFNNNFIYQGILVKYSF